VAALGTDWLAIRVASLPPEVETGDPAPGWPFAGGDWHVVLAWPGALSAADAAGVLTALVSAALTHAASLASV
jgi:hypothetical protein